MKSNAVAIGQAERKESELDNEIEEIILPSN
jgi:hypothetical protein